MKNLYEKILQQQQMLESNPQKLDFGKLHPIQNDSAFQNRPASFFDVITGRAPLNGINRPKGLLGALQAGASVPLHLRNNEFRLNAFKSNIGESSIGESVQFDGGFSNAGFRSDSGSATGGKTFSGGGRTGGERQIENNSRFQRQVDYAWEQSNPGAPKDKRREVGFFATISWGDRPGAMRIRFSGYKEGPFGKGEVNLGIAPEPPEGSAVISVHTHPFGLSSKASEPDREELMPYETGVIRSFGGTYWYGKVIL